MKNKNIKAVQNLIQCLPLEALKSPDVVANLVRAFGIVQWGPPVFGDDEVFKNPFPNMAGIYQTPDQLGKALVYLSGFEIKSYLEVGVFQGGCFLFVSEYLRRFNPEIQCLGIDPTGFLNDEIREIIDLSDWLRHAALTSEQIQGRKYDLVFIDGDHSAEWIKRDWENVGRHAATCMLHDIQETTCPHIIEFWKGLKGKGKTTVEFLDCSTESPLNGIGIIHNRKEKKA